MLSFGFVSVVWVETAAVLVNVVPSGTDADTFATIVIVDVPGSRRTRLQVMSWPESAQVHPSPVADTNDVPAGSVSTSWTR